MAFSIDQFTRERGENPKEANWLRHLPFKAVIPEGGYHWESYEQQIDEVEQASHYGAPLSPEDPVLVGDELGTRLGDRCHSVFIPWPYDVRVETEVSTKKVPVPLWSIFLNLRFDSEEISGFACQYGKLGRSSNMSIKRGESYVLVETTDTLSFWQTEIARLQLIHEFFTLGESGSKEDAIKLRPHFSEGQTESLPGQFEKAFFLNIQTEHWHGTRRRCISKTTSPGFWSVAQGQTGFFPEKLALAFADLLIEEAFRAFPVEVAIEFDAWDPYPVLKPSCLLSAILLSYLSFANKQRQYVFCANCGKMGPLESMVCRNSGEFIHKDEYPLFWKRRSRELDKQKKIRIALEAGMPLPKRGRPPKPLR